MSNRRKLPGAKKPRCRHCKTSTTLAIKDGQYVCIQCGRVPKVKPLEDQR